MYGNEDVKMMLENDARKYRSCARDNELSWDFKTVDNGCQDRRSERATCIS